MGRGGLSSYGHLARQVRRLAPLGSVSHGRSLSSSGETWMVRRSLLGQSNLPAAKLPKTTRLNIEDSDNRTI